MANRFGFCITKMTNNGDVVVFDDIYNSKEDAKDMINKDIKLTMSPKERYKIHKVGIIHKSFIKNKNDFDENMDKRCLNLCEVLNELDGISTFKSHWMNKDGLYEIDFEVCNFISLNIIARVIEEYNSFNERKFNITLRPIEFPSDIDDNAVYYVLQSETSYKDMDAELNNDIANIIAKIRYWESPMFKDILTGKYIKNKKK